MEPVRESRQLDDLSDASAPAGSWDWDSSSSSRSVSIVSYEYDPDDFPRLNEIEEFQSPSFVWPVSAPVSGRHNSLGRSTSIQGSKHLPKKLAAKLQTKMDHLTILLSLSDIASSFAVNSESIEVIKEAQHTLDKGLDLDKEDLDEIFGALETAVTKITALLTPNKVTLAKPIQLAELVAMTAGEVPARYSWYRECQNLKSISERLTRLLWFAASINLYDRPLSFIIVRVERILFIAGRITKKHHNPGNIARRILISSTSAANAFKQIAVELHDCIVDISWLIRICTSSTVPLHADIHEDIVEVPPFAVDKPTMLCSIWTDIAVLLNGSPQDKIRAAKSIRQYNALEDQYGSIIIEEGGWKALVKLAKEGGADAQDNAIQAIGWLYHCYTGDGREACSLLVSFIIDGPIQVRHRAAWVLSKFAAGHRFDLLALILEPLVKYLIDLSVDHNQYFFIAEDAIRTLHILVSQDPEFLKKAIDEKVLNRLLLRIPALITKVGMVQYDTARLLLEFARTGLRDVAFKMIFFDDILILNPEATIWKSLIQPFLEIAKKNESNEALLERITKEVIASLVGLLKRQEKDMLLKAIIALTKCTHEYCTLHEINNPGSAIAKPIICAIWEWVARMHNKSVDEVVATAVPLLVSFAGHSDKYGKIIIESEGVHPLLELANDFSPSKAHDQQMAIKALGFLGRDFNNARWVVLKRGGEVYSVLTQVLRDGSIQVKADAVWAVSQFAAHISYAKDESHSGLISFRHRELIVDQIQSIVDKELLNHELLLASIEAIGRLFVNTKVFCSLARLLGRQEEEVVSKVVVALTEMTDRYFSQNETVDSYYKEFAKTAAGYISKLVYRGHKAQKQALLLACSMATHLHDDDQLNIIIAWAYNQTHLRQDATIKTVVANLKHMDL